MNIYSKRAPALIIGCVSTFFAALFFSIIQAQDISLASKLTPQEQQWLAENSELSVAFDGYFPPYSYFDENGELVGLSVDTFELIAQKLGVTWKVHENKIWKEIYEDGISKKVDIIATMVDRPERHQHFLFSQPYISKPLVILTHTSQTKLQNRRDIKNKTVALVEGYQYSDRVIAEFPSIKPYFVETIEQALMTVEVGKVDAAIMHAAAAIHIQRKHALKNIKYVATYDEKSSNESMAVRKDLPILKSILDKAITSISAKEQAVINDRWRASLEVPVDYSTMIQLVVVFALFSTMLIYMILITKNKNKIIFEKSHALERNVADLVKLRASLEEQVQDRTESLTKSEEKYRHLIENLKEEYFFYKKDKYGKYIYVSPSLINILGHSVEEFIQNSDRYIPNTAVNMKAFSFLKKISPSKNVKKFELEIYNANSKLHVFSILETSKFDEQECLVYTEGIAQDITHLKKTEAELHWLSHYDDLTQLSNRRMFLSHLDYHIEKAKYNYENIAVLYLDLNRFKHINDSLGHGAGDKILQEVSTRIKKVIRSSDLAARIGGDEFAVVLPSSSELAAKKAAIKLSKSLQKPFIVNNSSYILGVSIGIAIYPDNGETTHALIQQADAAMYVAKRQKNQIAFCSVEQKEKSLRSMQIEQDLKKLLLDKNFEPSFPLYACFQPKINLSDDKISGCELLIRWNHTQFGSIPPIEFIVIAEETGLINKLTLWVFELACRQIENWNNSHLNFEAIAINISGDDLISDKFCAKVTALLNKFDVPTSKIQLEITETSLVDSPNMAKENLIRLHEMGFKIALDDFGTGYSSLSYLRNFPVDYIKIDRSFIMDMASNSDDFEVVKAIIAIAHTLKKKVIAEGVETKEQAELLTDLGCDEVQGYYYAKPLVSSEFEELVVKASLI